VSRHLHWGLICFPLALVACSASGEEWFLRKAGIPEGLVTADSAKPVTIAIVDDGVRLSHEEITPFLWVNPGEIPGNGVDDDGNALIDDIHGWDFGDRDSGVRPRPERIDEFYHGTHLAGIIAQIARRAYGEDAPEYIRLMAIKTISDASEKPYLKEAFRGIEYAMQMGADIILCAWGLNVISAEERALLDKAKERDCLIVASTGNFNEARDQFPAAHPAALAIAGHDLLGRKLSRGNFGGYVDLTAPGEDISAASSGTDSGRNLHSGTSQASAVVAASLAVLKLQNPEYSNQQLRAALLNNATVTAQNRSFPAMLGAGKLHLGNALEAGYDTQRTQHLATKGIISLNTSRKSSHQIGPLESVAGIRLSFPTNIQGGAAGTIHLSPPEESGIEGAAFPIDGLPAEYFVPGGRLGMTFTPETDSIHSELLINFAAEPINFRAFYCSGIRQLATEGVIEDGSGELPYAAHSDCKWRIKAPEGKTVRFTFLEFDTETLVDKLYFFHGNGTHQPIMAIYTGSELPPDMTSWGNDVLLWFVTDGRNQGQGWKLQYEFVDEAP